MSSNPATHESVDVVVIGAGLSGLRAALSIQAAGYSCAVVEAIDRVGGKTLTLPSKKSGPGVNDLGAAWINDTTQSEMYKLARKYGVQTEVQLHTGDDVWEHDGGVVLSPHGILPLSEEEQAALGQVMKHIAEIVRDVNLEDPISGPGAKELDSLSLHQFCIQTFQSEAITSLLNTISQSLVGIESKDLSALSFLHSCKCGTGIEAMISDTKNGGQYLRLRQGAQTISKKMAAELKPGSLRLSTPVTHIEQHSESGTCTVRTEDDKITFQAKKVILSVATPLYRKFEFNPPLPVDKQRLAEGSILGYYSKIIFVFDKPWWRIAGLSGEFKSHNGGPILFSVDTSIPDDDQWSISCFVVGGRGIDWSKLSQEERRSSAWEQLRSTFEKVDREGKKLEIPEPINVLEYEWTKQEYFLGGPCPVSPPGLLSSIDGATVCRPFGSIHFVGTETALQWKGYMEGAVHSGARGAEEVIAALCN